MPIGAAIGGVGALASAGASIYGANKAADAQTNAANQANSTIRDQFSQNSANLAPWMQNGANSSGLVNFLTGASGTAPSGYNGAAGGGGSLTARFAPTMEQLAQTPGYQFTLDQGLKATQNSYASKGLASSGAAMKGAADYAGGLASNTYQQQFQNYWGQNKSIYDMLTGQSAQGLQAAGALTGQGMQAAGLQSGNTVGAGNAQGAAWNATGAGIGAGINGATMYGILGNYLSNGTNNGNLSPAQFQQYGQAPATSLTDAQAEAYGKYMGY